jgi:sphingomyelin phosphodiesterase
MHYKSFLLTLFIVQLTLSLGPLCSACHDIVKIVQKAVPGRPSELLIDQIAITYCTQKHLQQKKVCKGAVKEMVPVIVSSTWKHYSDPHLVCSTLRLCSHEYTPRSIETDIARILQGKV